MRTLSILFIYVCRACFFNRKSFDSIVIFDDFCPFAFYTKPSWCLSCICFCFFISLCKKNIGMICFPWSSVENRNSRSFLKRNVMLNARLGSGGGEPSQLFHLRYAWVVRWLVGCLAWLGCFFFFICLNVIGSRWWWSKLLELLIIYRCWIVMDFHPFLVGRFLWQTLETRENNQGVFGALTKLSIYGQVRVSLQESNVSVGGWAMKKGPLVVTGYRQGIILPRLYGDYIYIYIYYNT